MAQVANTIPPKGLFSVKIQDFIKGIAVALFGNISAMIIFLLKQDHWPTWAEWQPYIIITVTTLLGYIGKNYLTNNVGQFASADKPVMLVDKEHYEQVAEKAKTADDAIG